MARRSAETFIKVLKIAQSHETQFPPLEEERADALEVAAQAHQEGKTPKEDGGGVGVYRKVLLDKIFLSYRSLTLTV